MKKMMRQAQRMQMQLNQAQAEVQQMTCEGTAGGGMVKAVVKGDMTLVSIEISPIVVTPDDVDMLQDLVVAAVNETYPGAAGPAWTEQVVDLVENTIRSRPQDFPFLTKYYLNAD